eukprot:g217.t1
MHVSRGTQARDYVRVSSEGEAIMHTLGVPEACPTARELLKTPPVFFSELLFNGGPIMEDNQACIQISKNPCLSGDIELAGIGTDFQVADVFTKPLAHSKFASFRNPVCYVGTRAVDLQSAIDGAMGFTRPHVKSARLINGTLGGSGEALLGKAVYERSWGETTANEFSFWDSKNEFFTGFQDFTCLANGGFLHLSLDMFHMFASEGRVFAPAAFLGIALFGGGTPAERGQFIFDIFCLHGKGPLTVDEGVECMLDACFTCLLSLKMTTGKPDAEETAALKAWLLGQIDVQDGGIDPVQFSECLNFLDCRKLVGPFLAKVDQEEKTEASVTSVLVAKKAAKKAKREQAFRLQNLYAPRETLQEQSRSYVLPEANTWEAAVATHISSGRARQLTLNTTADKHPRAAAATNHVVRLLSIQSKLGFPGLQLIGEEFRAIEDSRKDAHADEHVEYHHLISAEEFLFVLCKHLPDHFFETGETSMVLDLASVFHLFDSTNSGLIDYAEFLVLLAKHTDGKENDKLAVVFSNTEPRGHTWMRVEMLADLCKFTELEVKTTALLAKETIESFFEPNSLISKEEFVQAFEGKAELAEAFCSSLNSCSGMARRVEELKKWVPELNIRMLDETILPQVIITWQAKAWGDCQESLRMSRWHSGVLEKTCRLKEFRSVMLDSLGMPDRSTGMITDKGSVEYMIHLNLTRLFAVYHGPHHGHKDHGSVDTICIADLLIEFASELEGEGHHDHLAIYYDLLSFKFDGKINVKNLVAAIDTSMARAAKEAGADCLHPGYGFLSEVADLPRRCAEEGIVWIGPSADAIELFGNKASARQLAMKLGVPVIKGSATSLQDVAAVHEFMASESASFPLMLKAVAGGGGRGMREVFDRGELESAFPSAVREAAAAFGNGEMFVEELWEEPKHIEVQVLCDQQGHGLHLFERDCSVQRNHQKVVEIAPAPGMPDGLRKKLTSDALKIVTAAGYANAGTVEFLVKPDPRTGAALGDSSPYAFIECNPRIQVEHCVTEEVTGVDLVQSQILIAGGKTLEELGLVAHASGSGSGSGRGGALRLSGFSVQCRLTLVPGPSPLVTVFREPTGPGVRVDTHLYSGYRVPYDYDPLLAKVICTTRAPNGASQQAATSALAYARAINRATMVLEELEVGGIATNRQNLLRILRSAPLVEGSMSTALLRELDAAAPSAAAAEARARAGAGAESGAFDAADQGARVKMSANMVWDGSGSSSNNSGAASSGAGGGGGVRSLLDAGLSELGAVAGAGAGAGGAGAVDLSSLPHGSVAVPMDALLVQVLMRPGQFVRSGEVLAVISAMKVEQSLTAPFDAVVDEMGTYDEGDRVSAGSVLCVLREADESQATGGAGGGGGAAGATAAPALVDWTNAPAPHASLREMQKIRKLALGMGGEANLQRQRDQGKLNVRERVAMLLDAGSFDEVGSLAGFPHYNRDGSVAGFQPSNIVGGTGTIDGRVVVTSGDDFSIRGGHADGGSPDKQNYLERTCREMRCPMVRLLDGSSGGGSLVGVTSDLEDGFTGTLADGVTYIPGEHNSSLELMGQLLEEVPIVGVLMGPTVGLAAARAVMTHFAVMVEGVGQLFAAGPPVVEGTGQPPISKEELGGVGVHAANGSVDSVAASEQEAMAQVGRFLSYLPSSVWELPPILPAGQWSAPSEEARQELVRVVPVARAKSYAIRDVINGVVDVGSFFEIGENWGRDQVTGLARIAGMPVAILAQDCRSDGGGMSANGARKICRHVELINTFHLPMVSFVDCPGLVVGLAAETASTARFGGAAMAQLYSAKVPWFTCIVKRVFGLAGGMLANRKGRGTSDKRVAWPSGDWGSLPPEGGIQAVSDTCILSFASSRLYPSVCVLYQPDPTHTGYKRVLQSHPDPQSVIKELLDKYNATRSPLRTAGGFGVEDVIDPRDTRAIVERWLHNAYRILGHPDQLGPKEGGFHVY